MIASDVMSGAAVYLNDPSQITWNTTVLLPVLKLALRDLELILINNQVSPVVEVSATGTVTAGAKLWGTQPTNIFTPQVMFERAVGEDDSQWVRMTEKTVLPNDVPDTELTYWSYREGVINFIGATTTREVKLDYLRKLSDITDASSTVEPATAQAVLEAMTAEFAARIIGENPTRADSIRDNYSMPFKADFINILVKEAQNRPVRRKGYSVYARLLNR